MQVAIKKYGGLGQAWSYTLKIVRDFAFDRYWRNLRTFTLHAPVDYKIPTLGNWALNEQLPEPDFYA